MWNALPLLTTFSHYLQANDKFWKDKYDREAAKQARAAKRAEKKGSKAGSSRKKKTSATDLLQLSGYSEDDEEEVALYNTLIPLS